MTRTEVTCLFCGGRIRHHFELIFLHARCKPPIIERTVRGIAAPVSEEGATAMRWCERCQQYHIGPHTPQLGRHLRRALTRISRDW